MRPQRLKIRGFRSHRKEITIDFRGRSLIGLVGPNGAGKSSVLDAISFALYGRTPGEGRAVTKLINVRSEAAQVELWFTAGGETFRATRSLRAKGASQQSLERFEGVDGEKLATVTDKQKEMAQHVERLLGLDFDGFTRSVLLAQGRFAQLLAATPAEAAKVLTGLFGFGVIEKMKTITERRLIEVQAELRAAEEARALQADRVEEATLVGTQRLEAERAFSRFDAAAGECAGFDGEAAEVEKEIGGLGEHRDRLAAAAAACPSPDVRDRVLAAHRSATEAAAVVAAAHAEAADAVKVAVAALDEAVGAGLPGAIERLEHAIGAHSAVQRRYDEAVRRRHALDEEHAAVSERLHDLAARAEEAGTTRAAAAAADTTAQEGLRTAEATHSAHALAERLTIGVPCPVCGRNVEQLPEVTVPPDLDDVRAAAEQARLGLRDAESEVATLGTELAKLEAGLDALGRTVADAAEVVDRATAELELAAAELEAAVEAVAGDPAYPVEAFSAAKDRWDALRAAKTGAEARLETARTAMEAAAAASTEARIRELLDSYHPLVALLGPLSMPADPERAEAAVRELEARLDASLDEIATKEAALGERLARVRAGRAAALSAAGLEPDVDIVELRAAADRDVAGLRAREALLLEQVARGKEAVDAAELTSRRAVRLQRLNTDLAPGKFPQFLLDERRRELAAAGSEWFRELSAGRYEFRLEDSSFRVRELTAAGLVRDADTLGGGETFLASLSLALGLATLVGLAGGALDSFFIDEGFGSLDPESLDLAMEGVERLVGGDRDRLVLVVSHVPELRERIEDLVELGKDPATNETVVIRS